MQESKLPLAKRSRRFEDDAFIFKEHYFFCRQACEEQDPKHPEQWRKYSYCVTADCGDNKTFKDVILDTCDKRNDQRGDNVRQ